MYSNTIQCDNSLNSILDVSNGTLTAMTATNNHNNVWTGTFTPNDNITSNSNVIVCEQLLLYITIQGIVGEMGKLVVWLISNNKYNQPQKFTIV